MFILHLSKVSVDVLFIFKKKDLSTNKCSHYDLLLL